MVPRLILFLSLAVSLGAQQPVEPAANDAQSGVPAGTPAGATAQGDAQSDTQTAPAATPQSNPPAPAGTDQSTQAVPPPEVVEASPEPPGGAGPGILTRGYSVTPLETQELRFRPWLNFTGVVDSGLVGLSTKSGQLTNQLNEGVDLEFGIDGRRVTRKDTIELEFRGDLYEYTPNSFYDGGNYLLNLTYTHRFTKHISLALQESAGLYSNNYSLLDTNTDLSLGNTNLLVTPNTQIFDNRTLYLSTAADVIYQITPRLSIDLGGTGFLVRREASSLYGTTGAQARVDVTYRFTRRSTFGPYYGFTQYNFTRAFGGSNINTVGLLYSYELTKSLQFRVRGGGSQVVTNGLETITIDPTIAALLGYSEGQIAVHRSNYVPDLTAQLFKAYRVGTASIEFTDGVTPGNGLFLTSRHAEVSGHYDYIGLRRWTLQIGASRDTLSTLGVLVGQYTSYIADAGVVRTLAKGFQANLRGEYRHFDIAGAPFLRNSYRINLGIAWTPGEQPVKLF
jgi:hypothetical protein